MTFRVYTTPSFDRELKKVASRDILLLVAFGKIITILSSDPLNLRKEQNIKKLTDVNAGQWRIRFKDYRIRYDVANSKVILHSIRNRKDAYK